jgi:hypothetical protein
MQMTDPLVNAEQPTVFQKLLGNFQKRLRAYQAQDAG